VKIAFIKTTIVLLLTSVLLSQCTKIDTTSVGSGLIPGVDNIHTFDTSLNIVGNNFDDIGICDSVIAKDLLASGIIGNDPLFGSTSAEMYFEMKPSAFPVSLPAHDDNGLTIDSVVLVLKYVNSYGDSSVPQKVNVFELSENLKSDSVYKTCDRQPFLMNSIGSATFTPTSLKDSIHAFREDDANQLRIRLDNNYADRFVANAETLKSDSAFKEIFKGLAVVPDEAVGGEALNYFNLSSASSRVSIYVRAKKDTVTDTTVINLSFTSGSVQANYINRQRGSSEITQHLNENPNGDSLLFIQTYPAGSYAKLKIPSLADFPNSVINRAQLIVEQEYDPNTLNLQAPLLLYIDIPDSSGRYIPIPCDFSTVQLQTNFSTLGGRAQQVENGGNQQVVRYTFNISRYVQSIVTKKEQNATIRLRAPFYILNLIGYTDKCGQAISRFLFPVNQASFGGVKISGTNSQPSRIRLNIIYSKL